MKRDAYEKLTKWKQNSSRKPILLRGARQTGKTWILREFGQSEFDVCHYFNFEEDPNLSGFFTGRLHPETLIRTLEIYTGTKIKPLNHLIIFDEIQSCPRALNSLKYFAEDAPEYHVAAAGSLLGIHLADSPSFPVGKVVFLDLYPMSFPEFLTALGDSRYVELMDNHSMDKELDLPFHNHLIERLRQYYFVGGMPEAVAAFVAETDMKLVRNIQKAILDGYELDIAKHSGDLDTAKLSMIWNSIPYHLSRENSKFVFSAVRPGARARTHEAALTWLEAAGMILRSSCVHHPASPLVARMMPNIFKIYCLDTGLLAALSEIDQSMLVKGDAMFMSFHGALVENFVAQQLKTFYPKPLIYWKRKNNLGEIDFLLETDTIIPVEVKSGQNPKSKSLRSYRTSYKSPVAYRLSLLSFRQEKGLINLPLYAVHQLLMQAEA